MSSSKTERKVQCKNIKANFRNFHHHINRYDNIYPSMHPIFFAYGPRIKAQNVVEPFDTVDLIHLFCELLGIDTPDYVEGRRDNIINILNGLDESPKWSRFIVIGMINGKDCVLFLNVELMLIKVSFLQQSAWSSLASSSQH